MQIAASMTEVVVWRPLTRRQRKAFEAWSGPWWLVRRSPDGSLLVAPSGEDAAPRHDRSIWISRRSLRL
jgi:hypothetical protein